MNKVSTSERLKQIMKEKGLKQVDILALTQPLCSKWDVKMNKSDISQYVSGKVEPSQEKLIVLGYALNVSEAWLMGFDVPRERNNYEDPNILIYEAESDEIFNIFESSNYRIVYLEEYKHQTIGIVLDKRNQNIVTAIYEDDLVRIYENECKKHNTVTADTIIEAILNEHLCQTIETQYFINKYYDLDDHGKKLVDTVLDIEWQRSTESQVGNSTEPIFHCQKISARLSQKQGSSQQ